MFSSSYNSCLVLTLTFLVPELVFVGFGKSKPYKIIIGIRV